MAGAYVKYVETHENRDADARAQKKKTHGKLVSMCVTKYT